jgi:predicted hotdog family 3-hydroxylacyl-ACP dehydratase
MRGKIPEACRVIPHAPPFRFVDRAGEKLVTAGEAPWPPFLLVECMAQACAAADSEGRPGMLASLRDVQITRAPLPGEVLRIEVTRVGALGDAVMFDAVVRSGDEELARGRLAFALGPR